PQAEKGRPAAPSSTSAQDRGCGPKSHPLHTGPAGPPGETGCKPNCSPSPYVSAQARATLRENCVSARSVDCVADTVTGSDDAAQAELVASGPLSDSGLMRAMERAASTTTSSTGQTG